MRRIWNETSFFLDTYESNEVYNLLLKHNSIRKPRVGHENLTPVSQRTEIDTVKEMSHYWPISIQEVLLLLPEFHTG